MRYLNARWALPRQLGHICIFGMTGQGKSQTIKGLSERLILRGDTKVIDLYSGGAEEGSYYALKSKHEFWRNREFNYHNQITKATDFPVNCLLPMCKKLPNEIPDIYTPFTIPINSITERDLKSILGSDLTKNEIALWRRIQTKVNKNTTLPDLLNYMIDAKGNKSDRIPGVSSHGVTSVYNMFSAFSEERLFSRSNNELSIDLKKELKNKKVITSLILKYFPEHYRGFLINYFLHTIYDLMVTGEIKHNVVFVIREAGDFLEAMSDSPQEQAVKNTLVHIIRKGRKHRLYAWIDNQTPMNLDVVKTQFQIKICHYVDNTVELQNSLGDLGSMLLNKDDYVNLMNFQKGRCFILTQTGLFNPQILPPLSRMSGTEGNDFFTIWRDEKGSRFTNTRLVKDRIELEYKESEDKWKEILKERKMKIKLIKKQDQLERERVAIAKARAEFQLKEEKKREKKLEKIQIEFSKENEKKRKLETKLKIKREREEYSYAEQQNKDRLIITKEPLEVETPIIVEKPIKEENKQILELQQMLANSL